MANSWASSGMRSICAKPIRSLNSPMRLAQSEFLSDGEVGRATLQSVGIMWLGSGRRNSSHVQSDRFTPARTAGYTRPAEARKPGGNASGPSIRSRHHDVARRTLTTKSWSAGRAAVVPGRRLATLSAASTSRSLATSVPKSPARSSVTGACSPCVCLSETSSSMYGSHWLLVEEVDQVRLDSPVRIRWMPVSSTR